MADGARVDAAEHGLSGQDWPGRARMAAARLAAQVAVRARVDAASTPAARALARAALDDTVLDEVDQQALGRHEAASRRTVLS